MDVSFLVKGSEFVVKFYDYSNNPENENAFWSGATELVENYAPIGHSKSVKKAELVLRSEGVDLVLSSFTVRRSDLRNRNKAILMAWAGNPGLWSAFRLEIKAILLQWASAPP